jgi:4'-phosphopantetheinyl transferase
MNESRTSTLAVAYRNLRGKWAGLDGLGGSAESDPNRMDRRSRRRTQSSAAESLLGDLIQIVGCNRRSDWKLTQGQSGKPTLITSGSPIGMEVSLSHSRDLVLAAITNLGEIGVDIECRVPQRSILEIAAHSFGEQERQTVEAGGARAFYRIWTLREALAKACGIGFPILTDRCDYFPEAPASGNWQSLIDGRLWLFSTGDLPGNYAVSVAIALRRGCNLDCVTDLIPREFGGRP